MRKVLFMFGDLSDSDIEWFAAIGQRRVLPKGTVLVHQGKPIEEIFILLDGELTVLVASSQKQVPLNTLQKGEIIGELSFLDSRPPSATVVAETDVAVLAISREKLWAKLKRDTGFAANFYRSLGVFLADRLRNTTRRLGYIASTSLSIEDEGAEEVDPVILESVGIAAKRFEFLVEQVKMAGKT